MANNPLVIALMTALVYGTFAPLLISFLAFAPLLGH